MKGTLQMLNISSLNTGATIPPVSLPPESIPSSCPPAAAPRVHHEPQVVTSRNRDFKEIEEERSMKSQLKKKGLHGPAYCCGSRFYILK